MRPQDPHLLHDLIRISAGRAPAAIALEFGDVCMDYAALNHAVQGFANGVLALGLGRGDRVAVFLEKRMETVIATFGASAAGGVAVPVNPVLKPAQVQHILRDCGVRMLVTSAERLRQLGPAPPDCPELRTVILVDASASAGVNTFPESRLDILPWHALSARADQPAHRVIDTDMAAIFYTSGSTGKPKGVVVSHRNLVCGAQSVAAYLENRADDALLAALPLSFDAGFSQITTAFHAGARVALLNYLLPRDILRAIERHRITGLTAVPPLYMQVARLDWPPEAAATLRYFANTGGHMPRELLGRLRQRMPAAKPYLMYGLTEAFRSTYLPPEEVDRRPDSIGRAIPNAEILVLRDDGSPCAPGEPGELVHRGALVSLGYWNDPATTAQRFRPLPAAAGARANSLQLPEIAVFSGDTVRTDADGFLYFVGRRDEMIKTSGYRVSPTEIEEVLHGTGLVAECAVYGVPDEALGQAVCALVMSAESGAAIADRLLAACREQLPGYMVPKTLTLVATPLPRNPNGKIDRGSLARGLATARGEPPVT